MNYSHIRKGDILAVAPIDTKIVNDEFTIIATGRFSPGGEGTFPALEVICARDPQDAAWPDRLYSTHTLVARCSSGGISAPTITGFLLENGVYDLTLDEAKSHLDTR